MLSLMGYIAGKGLGKSKQGIIDPEVAARIVPPNTSLDFISEPLSSGGKRGKKRKRTAEFDAKTGAIIVKDGNGAHKAKSRKTVFDFLNSSIGDRKRHTDADHGAASGAASTATNARAGEKPKKMNESEARSKLLAMKEAIGAAEQDVKRMEQSLLRNVGKESEAVFRAKVNEAKKKVAAMQHQSAALQSSIQGKKTSKLAHKF